MGTWGAGILDDDFARDVYDLYLEAIRGGQEPAAAVAARVRAIVESGQGLARWREAGPDALRQRKAALSRFARELAKPARPARRGVEAQAPVPLDVGDCLAIDCADGRVEAAVVTRHKVSPSTTSHILTVGTVPEVPQPLGLKLATWANLWKIFPTKEA